MNKRSGINVELREMYMKYSVVENLLKGNYRELWMIYFFRIGQNFFFYSMALLKKKPMLPFAFHFNEINHVRQNKFVLFETTL